MFQTDVRLTQAAHAIFSAVTSPARQNVKGDWTVMAGEGANARVAVALTIACATLSLGGATWKQEAPVDFLDVMSLEALRALVLCVCAPEGSAQKQGGAYLIPISLIPIRLSQA